MLGLASALSTVSSTSEQLYSLSLDGTGDYVSIGNVLDLGTADFSLSTWVKIADWDGAHYRLFTKYEDSNNHWMLQKDGDGAIIFTAKGDDGDSDETLINAGTTSDTSTDNDGNWVHICLSVDRDGNFVFYKNGSAVKTIDISASAKQLITLSNAGEMRIGSQATNAAFDVLGSMDDSAIWNVALDADAVAAVYNSGKPFDLNNDRGSYDNSSALQGYWKMGNGPFDDKVNGVVHDAHNPGYGSELWDGIDGDDANWVTYTNNTKAEVDGAVEITYVDHAYGGYHFFRDTKDLNTDLTVGATYKLTFQTKVNTGSANWQVNSDDGGSATTWLSEAITSTDFIPITIYFIPATTTTAFIRAYNMGAGEKIYIKNISLKKLNGYPGLTAADATFSADTPDD